jgi:hypothetical protein
MQLCKSLFTFFFNAGLNACMRVKLDYMHHWTSILFFTHHSTRVTCKVACKLTCLNLECSSKLRQVDLNATLQAALHLLSYKMLDCIHACRSNCTMYIPHSLSILFLLTTPQEWLAKWHSSQLATTVKPPNKWVMENTCQQTLDLKGQNFFSGESVQQNGLCYCTEAVAEVKLFDKKEPSSNRILSCYGCTFQVKTQESTAVTLGRHPKQTGVMRGRQVTWSCKHIR